MAEHLAAIRFALRPDELALQLPGATYLVAAEVVIERPSWLGAGTDVDETLRPPDDHASHTLEGLLLGESLVGFPGALSVGMRYAMDDTATGGQDGFLVLTDQRLVVLDRIAGEPGVLWECERRHVLVSMVAPARIGRAGRVVILFVDGSGISFLLGVVLRRDAIRFVRELSNRD